jgi:hypothetical protein
MVRFSIPGPEVSVLNPRLADGEMKSSGGYVMPPSSPAGCAPTAPELLNKFQLLGNPFVPLLDRPMILFQCIVKILYRPMLAVLI